MTKSARFMFVLSVALGTGYWLTVLGVTAFLLSSSDNHFAPLLVGLELTSLPFALFASHVVRRRYVADAAALAYRDDLTGLPNRAYFLERLESAIARSVRYGKNVAVLFLDLDRFKLLNDTLGHAAGDKLLVEVSRRLRRLVRAGEMTARLGGDEFTIILEGVPEQRGAERMADRLLEGLAASYQIEGHEVFVTASIGIAVTNGQAVAPDELVRRADIALYQAKADGRACWRAFRPGRASPTVERLELDAALRNAIQRKELTLYYQPEIDLKTGAVAGFEALVRWNHPTRGLLLPYAFIPTAEEAGLIRSIGRWVLKEACLQAVHWEQELPMSRPLTVSVNVSPNEFRERELVPEIVQVLEQTGLAPSRLKLEIVENALMSDAEATITKLLSLRSIGVKLAIDDFGTGYSSLSYLRSFPVDTIKLDRAFVVESTKDPRVRAIICAVISLAHALDMDVTAEGVETNQELDFLMGAGCDRIQGYLFSRPLPVEAVPKFLAANKDLMQKRDGDMRAVA